MSNFERLPTWLAAVVVSLIGGAIILLHFSGLLQSSMNDVLWGISISADPISDLLSIHDFLAEIKNNCVGHITSQNFPFGAETNIGPSRYLVPGFILLAGLTKLTSQIFLSFNVAIMTLMLVNFLVTYYCFHKILGNRLLSLVPATLVAFSAYAYSHSWAHLGLMSFFYFPLFLFLFYRVQLDPERKIWQILAALVFALSAYCSPYYFYFNLWIAIAIFATQFVRSLRDKSFAPLIRANLFCAFLTALFVLPFIRENFFLDLSNSWQPKTAQDYGQNLYFLTNYSARPSDFFLPNVHNPWFGEWMRPFIADANQARNWWSDEFSISIGIVPTIFVLLLLTTACRAVWRRVPTLAKYLDPILSPIIRARQANTQLFDSLIILMICSFLLSLAPTISLFGISVPMPNEALRFLVPFRSYSRFAIIFLLALSLLLAMVIAQTRRQILWSSVAILFCVGENFPKTHLHNVAANQPYIEFLRSRPEQVIMRFERQNVQFKLPLKLELILAGKRTINGDINFNYGYTEWPLSPQNINFRLGHLGSLGAELLVVNGRLQVPAAEAPFLEELAYFADADISVWKIKPVPDERLASLMQPYISRARSDACYVAPKAEVQQVLQSFVQLVAQSPG